MGRCPRSGCDRSALAALAGWALVSGGLVLAGCVSSGPRPRGALAHGSPVQSAPPTASGLDSPTEAVAVEAGARLPGAHVAPRAQHVIEVGETLISIARRHGVSVDELLAANPRVEVRRLAPGGVLMLPPGKPRVRAVQSNARPGGAP